MDVRIMDERSESPLADERPNGESHDAFVQVDERVVKTQTLTKLVSGAKLLEILWDESSRPTMRWLRNQTRKRTIPFARSAGRVWFDPFAVKASLSRIEIRRGRPRKQQ